MAINQKFGLPRLADGQPFSFSRRRILDGTIKTFFGPDQSPGAANVYHPPAEWPDAGRLLRVPQVVWLTAYFPLLPFGFRPEYTLTAHYFTLPLTKTFTVPNHFYEEAARLVALFSEVKTAIESIRSNRTFVTVVPIFDFEGGGYRAFSGGPNTNYVQVQSPASDADFFGTDFLHVCCGDVGVGVAGTYDGSDSTVLPMVNDGFILADPFMEDFLASGSWLAAKEQMEASFPKFRQYAAWLYPHNLDWSDWPIEFREPDPPSSFVPLFPGLQDHTASNQTLTARIALELADFGFTCPGTSDTLSAETLVAAIAEHYRFDPETGADLP